MFNLPSTKLIKHQPEQRNPRLMGARAYRAGESLLTCPFDYSTGQHRRWVSGFIDAYNEDPRIVR